MNQFFNSQFPGATGTASPYIAPAISPYLQRPTMPNIAPNYPPIIQNFGVPQNNGIQSMIPNQTNIHWVNNENEIASFPIGRGWQQWFGNKNEQILYVRESDENGNIQPVVKLRYEVIEDAKPVSANEAKAESMAINFDGPSRDEFNKLTESVNMLVDKLGDLLK